MSNQDTAMCQFTDCWIRDANDCDATSSAWSGQSDISLREQLPTVDLRMDSSQSGYSHDICLRCTNGQVVADVPSFTVTVAPGPCASSLTDATGAEDTLLTYQSGGTSQVVPKTVTPVTGVNYWETLF